ncbi:cell wall anchor protein [Actinoplanes sp. SE50]|uniref:thioester domain-containing protein n=1 Tax=unclassified Actinoplanes TaxID=2626549 RepID=UPI00023EDCF4|nr:MULTISPECIES: thioester domain-containing protein [unclassified Actinoplanes]AEV89094.1 hypothetical protein ACPL_8216 [Actinoplanes sp. SE50/110]ATO87500.1 cell wall anchor protein [Actinoplanes sp. SE50]SLM04918.1 TQXA domain-containing protein [Actinoplanes sp. SE50/110]
MLGRSGRRWAQVAMAAAAGGALLLGAAAPAAADEPTTGVPSRMTDGAVTLVLGGKAHSVGGIQFTIKGQTVPIFCIDYHTGLAANEPYTEGTWDESEVKNLTKVQWVLAHGYPNGDINALLTAAHVQMPQLDEARQRKLLYFGTQTAVWHFSDGIDLGAYSDGARLTDKPQYDVVKGIYDYLTTNAVDQPEPAAQLTVTPASATAKAGEKAGPFTVAGPASAISVSVKGGSAVDADGKPVTSTSNGGKFWLTAADAGKATVTLNAEDSVSFGRVFLYSGGKDKHQKLILGSSIGKPVTASAEATFTPAPVTTTTAASPKPSASTSKASQSPSAAVPGASTSPTSGGHLALTGSAASTVAGGGVVLLVIGGLALMLVRRRRTRFTS